MNGESVHVGALVDSVQEVLEFDERQIQPSPSIGTKYKSEFIEGMAKQADNFIMILNMDMVFSTEELSLLKESSVSPIQDQVS